MGRRILYIPARIGYTSIKYGAFYNWYSAIDIRGIVAEGWHINTQSEWGLFQSYVSYGTGGGKLKKTGSTYWVSPNIGATDEYGFGAKGSGYRSSAGSFSLIAERCYFWSVTTNTFNTNNSYCVYIVNFDDIFPITDINKKSGLSIRPVKDSTILSDGESGIYIGNDGKVYRTICIGGLEFVADNIFETKYRNGDWIHGFDGGVYTPISNTDWAALTTEGMCVYNDDLSYALL
jgi:uncharacterized protein (TIGR02145 family)